MSSLASYPFLLGFIEIGSLLYELLLSDVLVRAINHEAWLNLVVGVNHNKIVCWEHVVGDGGNARDPVLSHFSRFLLP